MPHIHISKVNVCVRPNGDNNKHNVSLHIYTKRYLIHEIQQVEQGAIFIPLVKRTIYSNIFL